jgi:hypothetical protein
MDTELIPSEPEQENSNGAMPEPQIIEPEIVSSSSSTIHGQARSRTRKPVAKKSFLLKAAGWTLGLVGTVVGGVLAFAFAGVFLAVLCVIIVLGLLFLLLRMLFGGGSKVIIRRF